MAKIAPPTGGSGLQITELAPPGQHVAVCLKINDLFGVERPSFNNPQVKENKDVTRFIFGFVGPDGRPYIVQTYEFTISGAPSSNLMGFLKGWLGQPASVGWDYVEMAGRGAMITIAHKQSKTNAAQWYNDITGISPVHAQLNHLVPQASQFDGLIRQLEQAAASNAPQQAPGQPQRAPQQPPPQQQPRQMPAPQQAPGYPPGYQPHQAPPQSAPPGYAPGYHPQQQPHPQQPQQQMPPQQHFAPQPPPQQFPPQHQAPPGQQVGAPPQHHFAPGFQPQPGAFGTPGRGAPPPPPPYQGVDEDVPF